jgi:hypothetical protein
MSVRDTGPAMHLANMRALGVCSIDVACTGGRRAHNSLEAKHRTMGRFLNLALVSLLFGLQPSAASSRGYHNGAQTDGTRCAYQAQRAVARRHGLPETPDDDFSLRIYADPLMSQEADEAFDACVRRQPQ